MTTSSTLRPRTLDWQPEKHLRDGARIWIIGDVERFTSSYLAWSTPQELFKVGVYDLETEKIGFAIFGRDIAYAIIKAGIAPPPWSSPAPFGIVVHRAGHDDEASGRYLATVELLPIEPALLAIVPEARKRFAQEYAPNALVGMWSDLVSRAAKENAIEAAILGMKGSFAAGDVRAAVDDPDAAVTPVLRRLVKEGKLLPPTGKKRWTRYELAPPQLIEHRECTE